MAYNYLKAAAALRASSREQLAVYMRLAAESDSATAYKRVLDDAGEVRLSSVLTLSGGAMAPAFLHGDQIVSRTLHSPTPPLPPASVQLVSLFTSMLPFTFGPREPAAAASTPSGAAVDAGLSAASADNENASAGAPDAGKASPSSPPTLGSIMRTLLTPSFLAPDTLSPSDIVILTDPADARRRLLRRLAALPGAVLKSPTSTETLTVPPNHVWVERDAEMPPGRGPWEGRDSRDFGPVALANIVGRAIYCVRGPGDHAVVSRGGAGGGLGLADGLILGVELEGVLAAAASSGRREGKQAEKKGER